MELAKANGAARESNVETSLQAQVNPGEYISRGKNRLSALLQMSRDGSSFLHPQLDAHCADIDTIRIFGVSMTLKSTVKVRE
jgi:hypothetical protein